MRIATDVLADRMYDSLVAGEFLADLSVDATLVSSEMSVLSGRVYNDWSQRRGSRELVRLRNYLLLLSRS